MTTVSVTAPVIRVQLAEDRAQVVREGAIPQLEGARVTAVIADVSPVIVDSTLQCRMLEGDATVVDCRVKRQTRVTADQKPDRVAELESAVEEKEEMLASLDAELKILDAARKAEDETYALTLDESAEDASWGKDEPTAWGEKLDAIESLVQGSVDRLTQLSRARSECAVEKEYLLQALSAIRSADADIGASLEIDLVFPVGEKRPVRLEITYVVPGALWRPHYTATLLEGHKKVRVQCFGTIWQNTGETWNDAAIHFSTERTSLGVAPPLLESDVLDVERSGDIVHVETREEAIVKCGLGRTETVTDLPGIDDGGEVLVLEGARPVTVSSDGRPHRVPVFEFDSKAMCALRLCAELDESVVLVSEATNKAPYPLLPGPVELIRNQGIVGRSEMSYVAPNERFELGFGPDDALRVVREKEALRQDQKILSGWVITPYRVHLYLSNLSADTKHIAVRERVLVSEIDKIRVKVDAEETTDGALPDGDGFVDWGVELPGKGTKALRLAYEVKHHPDVSGLDICVFRP